MENIANQESLKFFNRQHECLRRLFESGLADEQLQRVIDDVEFRQKLLIFWRDPSMYAAAPDVVDCSGEAFVPDKLSVFKHQSFSLLRVANIMLYQASEQLSSDIGRSDLKKKQVIARAYHDLPLIYNRNTFSPTINNLNGHEIRNRLGKSALNANVLDFLLAHQEQIPESWQEKSIFFWGTIYLDAFGASCVRYLYWDEVANLWAWDYCLVDNSFGCQQFSAYCL